MKTMHLKICLSFLFFLSNFIFPAALSGNDSSFPVYPSIEPNVKFWTKIYSEYSTEQGVLHDSENLNVVYEVIDLIDPDRYGARKINDKRINAAKRKYKMILKKLAQNPDVSDNEARRIASLFGEKGNRDNFRRAIYKIRCQIGQKDRFREGIVRSGAWLEDINKIFRSYGLPEDLVYLPHVESSFNPTAYSKFGAAGIWQFVREAGKRYMTVGYALDERWDPIRSSDAAAQLLKHSYEKFKSWPLAITSYNHGISGMLSAKWTKGGYEEIFNHYKSKIFRFASRNFYSEFLAAREVATNYEQYFGKITLDSPVETRNIILAGYASIKDLSRYLGVDMSTLRKLNPSLRPPVFRGQKYVPKGYSLRLPPHSTQNRTDASMELPWNIYKHHQKSSRIYRVKTGDNITKISKIHGIKVSDLIAVNKLNSKGSIYVGQNLRLPFPDETPDEPKLVYRENEKNKPSETLQHPASEIHGQTPQVIGIGSGEPSSIYEDMIPASDLSIDPAMVGGDLQVDRVIEHRGKPMGIIRVEIEETLGHIAEWLEIPTRIIRNLNQLPYGSTLRLQQKVKIPLDKISKAQFEEIRFEYHKKIQEDFFSFYEIETVQIYQVKKGDNIWTLCNDTFEMPIWLVKKYNPQTDFNDLRFSQKLMIPRVKERVSGTKDIALPSPTVSVGSAKEETVIRDFWTDSHHPWFFMIQIIVCILLMAYLLLPELRWKTKKLFVFIRRVFENGKSNFTIMIPRKSDN